jgi:hypothetical protein
VYINADSQNGFYRQEKGYLVGASGCSGGLYEFLSHPHTDKKNLLESLCTKDRSEATNKAPAVIAKFQAVIAEARRLMAQANSPLGRVLAAHPDLRRMEEIADLVAEEGGEAFPEVRNLPRLAWEDIQQK